MEWVAIDVHIAGDAVTHRLAETFRLRVPEAAGLLALAFAGMAQHAQDGELADVTDSQLEAWVMWHGRRGAFAKFFRAQLCDEHGCVRAWEKYNGRSIRRAEAAKVRTQQWRAQRDAERTEREPSANGTHTRTHNETHNRTHNVRRTRHDRTGPDLEAKNQEQGEPAAAPPRRQREAPALPAWAESVAGRWMRRVGKVTPQRIVAQLRDAVDAHGEPAVLRAIDAFADARVGSTSAPRLEWFAEAVSVWVERSGPMVDPETGLLNERGQAALGVTL